MAESPSVVLHGACDLGVNTGLHRCGTVRDIRVRLHVRPNDGQRTVWIDIYQPVDLVPPAEFGHAGGAIGLGPIPVHLLQLHGSRLLALRTRRPTLEAVL